MVDGQGGTRRDIGIHLGLILAVRERDAPILEVRGGNRRGQDAQDQSSQGKKGGFHDDE